MQNNNLKNENPTDVNNVLADSGFVYRSCKGEVCSVCGKPATNKLEELAAMICNKLGVKYEDYVIEEPLPGKMTLDKQPDTSRQYKLTGVLPSVDLQSGIDRVLTKLRNA